MASVAGEHLDHLSFDVHDDVPEMMDLSEIDGALLMELLQSEEKSEDHCTAVEFCATEADRTTHAGAGFSPAPLGSDGGAGWTLQDSIHPHDAYCEDCGLDDMLSDLHCCDCSSTSAPMSPYLSVEEYYPIDWSEMETAAASSSLSSGDMGEWYVIDDCMHGCGVYFGHGDLESNSSLFVHMDNSVDQFYGSLWE